MMLRKKVLLRFWNGSDVGSISEEEGYRYTDTGFTVNVANYEGSLLCIGNLLMSWSPKKFSEITADSLSIFQTVRPIPILILGSGRYIQQIDPELRRFVRSTGMKIEVVHSVHVPPFIIVCPCLI
ncbi:unnamed protein product [Rhodiola kirilowii]